MATHKRVWWWAGAIALTLSLSGYLAVRLVWADKTVFMPGAMTDGHYQLESACEVCHTPFGGVGQDACLQCHGAELEAVKDSHPKSKFEDPRNADRLKTIDARMCVTCHAEHRPKRTRAMGVTLPDDLCFHCHAEVGEERASHKDLAFDTCASAGCHNYHDNSALYEDFLVTHRDDPPTRTPARIGLPELGRWMQAAGIERRPALAVAAHDAPAEAAVDAKLVADWAATAHARAGVNCRDCHRGPEPSEVRTWVERPDVRVCAGCHAEERDGFATGKHGMRLKQGMPPMRPREARRPMHPDSADRELGCTSCHGAHAFDTRTAAVASCLGCHDDPHSRAYKGSAHYRVWTAELRGESPEGAGVSCATCHLPRTTQKAHGVVGLRVEHNQNAHLRPNEKMIRNVCLNCHGLAFAIDALADPALVQRNFAGRPARHVTSLDMALERLSQPRQSREPRSTP
jgi:predicted CXXCH cytochrome family protein